MSQVELKDFILLLAVNSDFLHFMNARLLTPDRNDDFTARLKDFGNKHLPFTEKLAIEDPYFKSLTGLRSQAAKNI